MSTRDTHFLCHAIRIGARNQGRTWPNPSVGCVLVNADRVVATGVTQPGGRPHAETQAIAAAGELARGATAYVSLEPCAHHGETPPCANALIDAGIARVVVAAIDPDPRVSGRGIALLKEAGVQVDVIELDEAKTAHRGFFRRQRHQLPYVTLKLATSADGIMTPPDGHGRWITGSIARAHGHGLRARMDAILTGIGTVLADDPQLTARLPGVDHGRFTRIVADRHLRLPVESKLVQSARTFPVWVVTTPEAVERQASHATDLREAGVEMLVLEDAELTPLSVLKALAAQGITRVMVEAGPALCGSLLAARCVDALYWYRAPMFLGNTGQPSLAALHSALEEATQGIDAEHLSLGPDTCDIYELDACLPD